VPDFSWYNKPKRENNTSTWPQKYKMSVHYTKIAIQIPNGREIHQICRPKAFQNIPKLVFLA
jgi:hypothetical protein